MWTHSFYLGLPATMTYFIYTRMPGVWKLKRATFPFKALALNYISIVALINAYNTVWSLAFEDYCIRSSAVYDTKRRNAKVLRDLIRETNETHKKTVDGKANTALSEEEILNEK